MSFTDPCITGKNQFKKFFLTNNISFPQLLFMNYHKLGSLKQQKCILSRFWRPESRTSITGSRSRYWHLLQRYWLTSSLSLPVSGGCWCSLACGHTTPVSASVVTLTPLCVQSPSASLLRGLVFPFRAH